MTAVRVLAAFVALLCLWSTAASGIGSRRKRLLHGFPLQNERNPPAYSAIRYTVWIGDGNIHFHQDITERIFEFLVKAKKHNIQCTGVLLTPDVVQVPCTCVAVFEGFEGMNTKLLKAVPLSLWENVFEIFFSEVEVKKMDSFILAKHYIIYEKCQALEADFRDGSFGRFYTLYDYGLIVLRKKITEVPAAEISYAPTPTFEDIIRHYQEALRKEFVCLFFGYGSNTGKDSGDGSDVLRYGWRSLMNYQDCYVVSFAAPVDQTALVFDYKSDATWVCAKSHRPHTDKQEFAASNNDNGGPVTCSEQYFGFIQMSIIAGTAQTLPEGIRPRISINLVNPIVFSLWENSVNYRELFLSELKTKLKGQETLFPDAFDVHIEFHPTEHLFALSRSPAISASIIYSSFFTLLFKNLP